MPDATTLHDDNLPSDIVDVLGRTTPRDMVPLDLPDLARRGRRRGRRQRSAAGLAVVAVVSAVTAAVVQPWSHDDPAAVETNVAGPNGEPLTDPAGSWSALADPPFSPRFNSFGGTLGDGRVLVWGGEETEVRQESITATPRFDGGIYDPGTDGWTSTADPPESLQEVLRGSGQSYHLVADRLAVVSDAGRGGRQVAAAVYDVAEDRWYEAPPDEHPADDDAVAWDGETLAVVKLDAAGGEPVTLRWTPGDSQWHTGAEAPLGSRSGVGTASDGARLAVWGGSTNPDGTGDEPDPASRADGAIYDVAADSWQAIPAGPLAGRSHPSMLWAGDRLVVGGGMASTTGETGLDDVASYTPATGTWATLPAAPQPEGGDALLWVSQRATTTQVGDGFVAGAAQFLVADAAEPQTGLIPRWVLIGDRWELAPANFPDRIGDFTVASTGGYSIDPDTPFTVQVRIGPDEWLDAAEAPFTDLMEATVVVTGNELIVVGGHHGVIGDEALPGKAWSFDLAG